MGWVYALNAVSFLFVIGALLAMDPPRSDENAPADRGNFTVAAALEGLSFVFRAPLIRSTMLLDFFATFFSSATALLPIFAQDILHVGARLRLALRRLAAGALLTSAIMVRMVDWIERRGEVLIGAVAIYGSRRSASAFPAVLAQFLCLAATGAADTVSTTFRNLIRQLETPDRLRGRMIGVNMVFFIGGPQLGELEAGLVANWLGRSVVTGGLGCIARLDWAITPVRAYRRQDPLLPVGVEDDPARPGRGDKMVLFSSPFSLPSPHSHSVPRTRYANKHTVCSLFFSLPPSASPPSACTAGPGFPVPPLTAPLAGFTTACSSPVPPPPLTSLVKIDGPSPPFLFSSSSISRGGGRAARGRSC